MDSAHDDPVLAPFNYLLKRPGKNIRDALIAAFALNLGSSSDLTARVSQCITTLHTASMLIDDVEDDATTRRGAPAAHRIYGAALTINCSHYVVFQAMHALPTHLQPIFLEEMLALHKGQGLDIYWRDTYTTPKEHEYLEMVQDKTGGLLRMAVRLLGGNHLVELANTMGILYQIQDDLLNLTSNAYHESKGFCEDLTEGKYSFPVIHCLENSDGEELKSILKLRTTDPDIKRRALELMEQTGSFEYTQREVLKYHDKVNDMIGKLSGDVGGLNVVLKKLVMV